MPKLHEVVAARTARQKTLMDEVITLANTAKKSDLFTGVNKVYEPIDEEGTVYPNERQHVRHTATELIKHATEAFAHLADLTLTNDTGNSIAFGSIILSGDLELAADVPIPTLMYLEKWTGHIRDFVRALPVTDNVVEWGWDADQTLWKTEQKSRLKTKKTKTPVVLYEATPEHPAQVELVGEDVPEGYWLNQIFSGALSPAQKRGLLDRIEALNVAVRQARERANATTVENKTIGKTLLDYIFNETSQV